MGLVRATILEDCSMRSIRAGLMDVVEIDLQPFADVDSILVVPDAHYPYHPSTGLVTNPDVLEVILDVLASTLGADRVALASPPSKFLAASQIAAFLRYSDIAADLGVAVVDLEDAERVRRTVALDDGPVTLSVPAPLLDATIVAVPSLRRSADGVLECGMRTMARAAVADPDGRETRAMAELCAPALSVIDGTYSYADGPKRSRVLLAGTNVVETSIVSARLFGLSPEDVPHLSGPEGRANQPDGIEGADPRQLAAALPSGAPPSVEESETMARGYQLYAKLAGDLVPPQLLGGGDE